MYLVISFTEMKTERKDYSIHSRGSIIDEPVIDWPMELLNVLAPLVTKHQNQLDIKGRIQSLIEVLLAGNMKLHT